MHAKDPLECRNKIIDTFKDGTFRSEHLKGLDDTAYDYVLKDVNKFTEEIRSMEEKINLSLFEEFFEYSSPADFAKIFINIKNRDKNKKNVEDIENRILALKNRIEKMSKKEKKNAGETLEIIRKTLDYNKIAQNLFYCASKVDKKNQSQRLKKVLQRG